MSGLFAIAQKDLRLLRRDLVALFWSLGFPLVFAVVFGSVLRRSADPPSRLSIVVVDDADPHASAPLLRALTGVAELSIAVAPAPIAEERVRRGDAVARVHVPATFGAGDPGDVVEVAYDASRRNEAAIVSSVVAGVVARVVDGSTGERCRASRVESRALQGGATRDGRGAGEVVAFPAAVLWSLIGCAGSFATTMVSERRAGTLLRLWSSPMSRAEVLGGKVLACFVACLVDAGLLTGFEAVVFGLRVPSVALLAFAIVSAASAFAGLTVLLGSLGRSEQAVGGAAWATLLFFAMVGGAMVPSTLMPTWLARLGELSAVRWGIVALEGATFRARPFAELFPSCASLLGVGVASFGAASVLVRRASP